MFLILIALAPVLSAISITIDMEESFGLGEEISFTYTIVSESSQEIQYIASVNCPNAPLPLLEIKTANLEANVPFTKTYIYMSSVSENIEPQTCEAGVGILSPEILESKSFTIETNPSFEFNIILDKKIFVKNEDIYLDYTSEVSEPIITASLIYPNGKSESLILPTSIKAEQLGTYNLEVTASKGGHKTVTKKIQFGVIKEEADIPYTSVRDIGDKKDFGKYIIFVLAGIIFILIVFVFIKIFRILKKRRKLTKKKLGLQKELKKGLKKKEKGIEKKERKLIGRLFHRKKKLVFGKKKEVDEKIKQEKKAFVREKVGVRKEFSGRLKKEGEMLKKKEEKKIGGEKIGEIRRLLSKGRRQLSLGNKWGAKHTYRKLRRLHASLKHGEKSRELYNQILIFHRRLGKKN